MTRPLWPYAVAIVAAWLIVGRMEESQRQAELRESTQNRVAAYCHRLGRTVAEDSSGRFTCEDLAPSWVMRSHIQIAEQIRSMK